MFGKFLGSIFYIFLCTLDEASPPSGAENGTMAPVVIIVAAVSLVGLATTAMASVKLRAKVRPKVRPQLVPLEAL